MDKVTTFFFAFPIMVVLTLLQRFFLDQSDSGKAWALMARWFALCDWCSRKSRLVSTDHSESVILSELESQENVLSWPRS
jgi:hypothetical protein